MLWANSFLIRRMRCRLRANAPDIKPKRYANAIFALKVESGALVPSKSSSAAAGLGTKHWQRRSRRQLSNIDEATITAARSDSFENSARKRSAQCLVCDPPVSSAVLAFDDCFFFSAD